MLAAFASVANDLGCVKTYGSAVLGLEVAARLWAQKRLIGRALLIPSRRL
jgi:hypothetical protein